MTKRHHRADHRHRYEDAAEEQAPQPAPEQPARAPETDPVALVEKADNVFVGVVAFADNAEMADVEPGQAELLDGGLRCGVAGKSADSGSRDGFGGQDGGFVHDGLVPVGWVPLTCGMGIFGYGGLSGRLMYR